MERSAIAALREAGHARAQAAAGRRKAVTSSDSSPHSKTPVAAGGGDVGSVGRLFPDHHQAFAEEGERLVDGPTDLDRLAFPRHRPLGQHPDGARPVVQDEAPQPSDAGHSLGRAGDGDNLAVVIPRVLEDVPDPQPAFGEIVLQVAAVSINRSFDLSVRKGTYSRGAVLPLVLTTVLCEALMVMLGIGAKVATLPVIALGVGIGVDYALYLLSVLIILMRRGEPLSTAYRHTLRLTGRVVALVGITLAAGVVTWAWSPIKFQADMGILLTFMFVINMIGALILVPALSHFLLRPRRRRQRLPTTHEGNAASARQPPSTESRRWAS